MYAAVTADLVILIKANPFFELGTEYRMPNLSGSCRAAAIACWWQTTTALDRAKSKSYAL